MRPFDLKWEIGFQLNPADHCPLRSRTLQPVICITLLVKPGIVYETTRDYGSQAGFLTIQLCRPQKVRFRQIGWLGSLVGCLTIYKCFYCWHLFNVLSSICVAVYTFPSRLPNKITYSIAYDVICCCHTCKKDIHIFCNISIFANGNMTLHLSVLRTP